MMYYPMFYFVTSDWVVENVVVGADSDGHGWHSIVGGAGAMRRPGMDQYRGVMDGKERTYPPGINLTMGF